MPTCLACGGTASEWWAKGQDEEYLTTKESYSFYKCVSCGVLSIDPVPRAQLSQIYPSNYYSFDEQVVDSLIFRVKDWLDQRFYKTFISRLPQREISVLDIGGGAGVQASAFRRADPRIRHTVIVDLNEKAGEKARQNGHEYFHGRFEDFVADRKFDVVLMLNLIEHVDNPKELLASVRKILSPEGIVLIKTPNTDSWDARLFRHANWGGYHCPRHWVLFNDRNLAQLVDSVGLKVRYLKHTQGAPFWTTSVLFWMSRKGWIHTSPERPVPQHPLYPVLNALFAAMDMGRGFFAKTSQMFLVLEHKSR